MSQPPWRVRIIPSTGTRASPLRPWRALLAQDDAAILVLRQGEMLAPGALTALAFELAWSDASAVAGLRVLYDEAVRGLDVPALTGQPEEIGGEVLWAPGALKGGSDLASAWAALPTRAKTRIGRPVLLRRGPAGQPAKSLGIVSLTGTGTVGGAWCRPPPPLEALALAHHNVSEDILSDRPAAAEWTDSFPEVEARIAFQGPRFRSDRQRPRATRSLDVVGRLASAYPSALVLHDLFALTGRCCHRATAPAPRPAAMHLPHTGRVPAAGAEPYRRDAQAQACGSRCGLRAVAARQLCLDEGAERGPSPCLGSDAARQPRLSDGHLRPGDRIAYDAASACPRATC